MSTLVRRLGSSAGLEEGSSLEVKHGILSHSGFICARHIVISSASRGGNRPGENIINVKHGALGVENGASNIIRSLNKESKEVEQGIRWSDTPNTNGQRASTANWSRTSHQKARLNSKTKCCTILMSRDNMSLRIEVFRQILSS